MSTMNYRTGKITMVFLFAAGLFFSCDKEDKPTPGFPPPDDNKYLLKEITIQNLPSPYFRFDYYPDKTVEEISFASNLVTYHLNYSDGKINTMTNVNQQLLLEYEYTGDKVAGIRSHSLETGIRDWTYRFGYNSNSQLSKVTWYRFLPNGIDSVKFRETSFLYNNDFNLASYEEYGLQTDSSFKWNKSAWYSGYDNGRNVDAFHLFKEFFEDLLFLPGVRLQINNPRSIILKAGTNEFAVTNSFQYSDDKPLSKTSIIHQTKGSEAGRKTQSLTRYSYY